MTLAQYNADNQVTSWAGTTLVYDLNGNMVGDGTNTYTWNERDQLAAISGGSTASFVYDGLGRRRSKIVGGVQTGFVYDGENFVQELSGASVTANLMTAGIDELFARKEGAAASYPIADALGSVIGLTDTSGALQTQYSYEPYGNAMRSGAATHNSQTYTGREDDGAGLYYYRARYYSATISRFIAEDPMGVATGPNTYAYVDGNPISRIDPLGLYDLTFSAGFHVPISPGVAIGPNYSSSIKNYSQDPYGPVTSNLSTTDIALGVVADAGATAGISDLSGTGGACAGYTINLGAGRYAGAQITLRTSQDTTKSVLNPLRYIDGVSIGLGAGIASPVSGSRGF